MDAPNPDFERVVRAAVLSMPAARHLGFDIIRLEPGRAEIAQPYREELTQHDGYVQGGVLGSLADFAAGSAAATLLPAGWVTMTVDVTLKILAPARGTTIVARGRVVKPGRTTTVAAADVVARGDTAGDDTAGDDEEFCATALVTMRNLKVG